MVAMVDSGGVWRIVVVLCGGGCDWIVCLGTVLMPRVWAAGLTVDVESAAVWWLDFEDWTARMRSD